MRGLVLSLIVAIAGGCPGGASAQQTGPDIGRIQSAVLVIDIERAFADSAFGRQLNAEVEAESTAIVAENRRIEASLIEEEQRLTDQRPGMTPEDFRALADAFDEKVQRLRAEQDAKAEALGKLGEESRLRFLQTARPVLEQVLRDTGAVVILERRGVLVAADAVDITDRAIALIDARVGDSGLSLPAAQGPAVPPASP